MLEYNFIKRLISKKGIMMTKKKQQEEISNNPFKSVDSEKENELPNEEIENNTDTSEKESENQNEEKVENGVTDIKLKEDFENLNNQYIRLAADFDNYRKRQAQERESLISYGAQDAMKKIIEVLDNFDRAKSAIEKTEDVNSVKDSFNVLYNQMFDNLSKLGLEVIKAQGEEFDPNYHEAVMQTPTSEHPENHVIMELQKGYKLGDKVLRPTLVNVATNE